ncbi:MAG: putative C-S lyase/pyridoxal phosphate-dependent aminotransferase [Treponematales bacterium]
MPRYDFETLVPRFGRGSNKWETMRRAGVRPDEGVIPFSVADMEFVLAPEIAAGLKRFIDTVPLGYASPPPEWFDALADWLKRRHGWDIDRSWVQDTAGVIDSFDAALRAFTGKGDGVLLMTPVYYPMRRSIEQNQRVVVETRLVPNGPRYEIDFDDMDKQARKAKALLFCSPHNPVSRVWTRVELERIGAICVSHGLTVIADEIHNDIVMPGYTHTVFASLCPEFAGRSATLVSASKSFNLAGMRTSAAIIPDSGLRRRFTEALKVAGAVPQCGILGYEASRLAWEEGGAWLDAALEVIAGNGRLARERLARELPEARFFDMEGTYLLWLDFNGLCPGGAGLERLLREDARLFFDEGTLFGESGRGFERWNLACPRRFVDAGISRLVKAVRERQALKKR